MDLFFLAFVSAAESLLTSWWQVVLVVVVSFSGITICWSMYRFRLMLENLKLPERLTAEDGFGFFQAMIAQKISAIRSHTAFGVGVIRSGQMGSEELAEFIRHRLRGELDGVIRVDDWVGVIIFGEQENLGRAFARWRDELGDELCAGATFYPDYARLSTELIEAAQAALLQAPAEAGGLVWAELDEEEDEDAAPDDAEETEVDEDDEIASDSSLDPLTGVLAMHKVASYMRKFIGEYWRTKPLALFFIGLNGMDDIESLHGKEAGDAVRKAVSDLIQDSLREDDVIGRYDDDEFLALMICEEAHVASIARRLRDRSVKLVVEYNRRRIKVTVSVGVSLCPRHGRNLPALFNAAKGVYDLARSRQGSMILVAGEE